MTDDAIARASEMSVRTVRRHIASIMEVLGTNTRFATGVAASKRGWV
jgi:DNA-binding NarL/FixJ family response regulator